ncbi:condensation domain-containing protein [Phytohabitans sp. ZYX-F-186]|uniref:Condensation domain-containing protein n=1 Tax=Phytohabitans maris TaxID=3071409 RepID=A0ABU0ZB92_9ACTN|nr:condensation domain-containing protein [Phytohabitans sp. ZYX-F-186]MDQ7903621.1 condensation domain-containing protein [Phytohabitans sp. ZYX-F-186]
MDGTRPLSVGQESLWLLHKLAPDSAAYNLAGGARMAPAPDVPALARAVRALSARHDGLRSVFVEVDGRPRRVVREAEPDGLDVRDVPDADDERLWEMVLEVTREPFALTREARPFRAVLLRRREDAAFLMVTHHIVTDATSQWLLWRDLIAAYEAYATGGEPDLPPVRASYDDHVAREARLLDSPSGERMAEHWREVCAGAVPAELPTDRPRPPFQSFQGASVARRLPDEVAEGLRATAARIGVSPFAFLLGTFQGLLYRHTGQPDFTVGCPASTRRAAAREVVGYYVNPILLRSRFARSTTFADAAVAANHQVRRGMAGAAYPYPLVAREAAGPLFRIAVTMVAADRFGPTLERAVAGEVMHVAGRKLSYMEIPHMEGQCDLTVEFTQDASALVTVFRYDTDLFERATVDRLLDHFVRLVEAGVADPLTKITRAPLVSAAERQRLLAMGT